MPRRTPTEFAGDRRGRGRCLRLDLRTLLPAIESKWIWSRPLDCHAAQLFARLSIKTRGASARVATRAGWHGGIARPLLLSLTWSRRRGGYGCQVILSKSMVERRKVLLDELLVVRDHSRKFRFYCLKQV